MLCEVLRPFQATNDMAVAPGPPGEPCIVETAEWREASVFRLIKRRFLRPLSLSESYEELEKTDDDTDQMPALPTRGRVGRPRHTKG